MYSSVPTTKPLRVTRSSPELAIARAIPRSTSTAPPGGTGDGQLGMQPLDGHVGAARVPPREDAGVPAPAHRGDHAVAIAQGLADPVDQIASRHGIPSRPPTPRAPGVGMS